MYVKVMIYKINLVKQNFVLELEWGKEVFIPKSLAIQIYPINFRFYDSIMNIIQENISKPTKEFQHMKN